MFVQYLFIIWYIDYLCACFIRLYTKKLIWFKILKVWELRISIFWLSLKISESKRRRWIKFIIEIEIKTIKIIERLHLRCTLYLLNVVMWAKVITIYIFWNFFYIQNLLFFILNFDFFFILHDLINLLLLVFNWFLIFLRFL